MQLLIALVLIYLLLNVAGAIALISKAVYHVIGGEK